MDKYTYGDSPAAVKLVEILEERNYHTRKINNILQSFNLLARDLKYQCVLDLVYKNYINKCDSIKDLTVRSHVKTVLKTKYRVYNNNLRKVSVLGQD